MINELQPLLCLVSAIIRDRLTFTRENSGYGMQTMAFVTAITPGDLACVQRATTSSLSCHDYQPILANVHAHHRGCGVASGSFVGATIAGGLACGAASMDLRATDVVQERYPSESERYPLRGGPYTE